MSGKLLHVVRSGPPVKPSQPLSEVPIAEGLTNMVIFPKLSRIQMREQRAFGEARDLQRPGGSEGDGRLC